MFRTDIVEEENVNIKYTHRDRMWFKREKNKEIFRFWTNKGFVKHREPLAGLSHRKVF